MVQYRYMEEIKTPSVHVVLAKSYLTYFLLCSFGLFFDIFFPVTVYVPKPTFLAIVCFTIGPLLILWAQYTSHKFEIIKKQTGELKFNKGPYKFLRNPTQLGLVILVGGYTLVTQAGTLFIATGLAYIISNVFFRKHESILESKYGQPYQEYKSSVPKVM